MTPGTYTARLSLHGQQLEQRFEVREDPRVSLTADQRVAWFGAIDSVAIMYRAANAMADTTRREQQRLAALPEAERRRLAARVTEVADVALTASELTQRLAALYGNCLLYTSRCV